MDLRKKWILGTVLLAVLGMLFGYPSAVFAAENTSEKPHVTILENGYDVRLQVETTGYSYMLEWDIDRAFTHKNAYPLYDNTAYHAQIYSAQDKEITLHLPKEPHCYYIRVYGMYLDDTLKTKVTAVSNLVKVDMRDASITKKTGKSCATLVMDAKGGNRVRAINVNMDEPDRRYTFPKVEKSGYRFKGWYIRTGNTTMLVTEENGASMSAGYMQKKLNLRPNTKYDLYARWEKVALGTMTIKTAVSADKVVVHLRLPKNATGYMVEFSRTKGFSQKKIFLLNIDDGDYLTLWNVKCRNRDEEIRVPITEFAGKYLYVRAYCRGETDSTGVGVLGKPTAIHKLKIR